MNNLAYDAMFFARWVHAAQRRKYTGELYASHLAEVAGIVATVAPAFENTEQEMIAVAWLHDCMEDQDVTYETLVERFGAQVATGVAQLSDLEEGNRAERKAKACERLGAAWPWVQTVKCADIISNTSSIVLHDPTFAKTYLSEISVLLPCLNEAHALLHTMARAQVRACMSTL